MTARSLSREEEAELAQSNKKIKDFNHASFNCGSESEKDHSPFQDHQGLSFKEKLLGDIPGAYTQAFDFSETLDLDVESDDEMAELREGMAAVKLSRTIKQRIRAPWSRALIVKVFGRMVGFNYLHSKLISLWKPVGKMDCVDLEEGYFLTCFSLKEDHDSVLRKGPWFIGGHFLSIRPWEPNFRTDQSNVTSVAVWVRLNRLPIEYYEAEVLKQIGQAIGTVLRIDTHTATESRGRYARLCLQIDIEKPLISTVLIGKLEQPVVYEGLHQLCFACGKVGHRKGNCPYVTRRPPPPVEETASSPAKEANEGHVSTGAECAGTSGNASNGADTSGSVTEGAQEGTYGPWLVVMRKKSGRKMPKFQPLGTDQRDPPPSSQFHSSQVGTSGAQKDAKRKLPLDQESFGLKVRESLCSISKKPLGQVGQSKIKGQTLRKPATRPVEKMKKPLGQSKEESFPIREYFEVRKLQLFQSKSQIPLFQPANSRTSFNPKFQFSSSSQPEMGEKLDINQCGENQAGTRGKPITSSVNLNSGKEEVCRMEVAGKIGVLEGGEIEGGNACLSRHHSFMEVRPTPSEVGIDTLGHNTQNHIPPIKDAQLMEDSEKVEGGSFEVGADRGSKDQSEAVHMDFDGDIHNPAIMVIMETKVGGDKAKEITDRLPFDGVICTETKGLSGGLWLLWNSDMVEVSLIAKTEQEIHALVKVRPSNLNWLFSAVYASPKFEERCILWNNLVEVSNLNNLPWVLAGDFNEPLMNEDKLGGRAISISKSLLFKECLDRCNMVDLGFSGPRFTRTNKRGITDLIQERIDRIFVNPEWWNLFPEAKVTHLPRCQSDHCPVLLESCASTPIHLERPFKFQSF